MSTPINHDPAEIARFDATAQRWWDANGEFRPLHDINAVRIAYMIERVPFKNKLVLDIGCGGGLAAEAMARSGATVTGIDLGAQTLEVARLHALESGLQIQYELEAAETHAAKHRRSYDIVTCLEMLEHVPDPVSIVRAAAELVRPGGAVFFSTINRNLKAYMLAIVAAEYVMKLLTPGTHTYSRFIKPSELGRWCRSTELNVLDIAGIEYNPLTRHCAVNKDPSVNYLLHACAMSDA